MIFFKSTKRKKKDIVDGYLQQIFIKIKTDYGWSFKKMSSVKWGFKCNEHCYCLDSFENFPKLSFCKISYRKGKLNKMTKLIVDVRSTCFDNVLDSMLLDMANYNKGDVDVR